MSTLAVIIARAGSKGLIKKNIRQLAGKPLVAWTIEHALQCSRVDDVAVSSDCPEVLRLARQYGVNTFERPEELAGDQVTIDTGARHGAECWAKKHGRQTDHVAIMYGNVAIRPDNLTDLAIAKLIQTRADSVQSVTPVGKMHPLWMRQLDGESGDELNMYQPNRIFRRQDLPPVYMLDAGAIVCRWQALFTVDPNEPHAFLGRDRRGIVAEQGQVMDIDSTLDLRIAEVILESRHCDPSSLSPGIQPSDHAA